MLVRNLDLCYSMGEIRMTQDMERSYLPGNFYSTGQRNCYLCNRHGKKCTVLCGSYLTQKELPDSEIKLTVGLIFMEPIQHPTMLFLLAINPSAEMPRWTQRQRLHM